MRHLYKILFIGLLAAGLCSCKDFLETSPTDSVSDQLVFNTVNGAQAALNGCYYQFYYGDGGANRQDDRGYSTHLMTFSACGEDMIVWGGWYPFDYNFWGHTRGDIFKSPALWNFYYRLINNTNSVITYIDDAEGDEKQKDYIKGQALALRGFAYFNLVRLYQHTYSYAKDMPGVPIYTEPTTDKTVGKGRGTVEDVYTKAILPDLQQAETLLEGFTRETKNYIDQSVVRTFLAQVYLTMENWPLAQQYAHKVNEVYPLTTNEEYNAGFNTPTPSWILCQYQDDNDNMWDGSPFAYWANWIPPRDCDKGWTYACFFLAESFCDLFEDGDIRKDQFGWERDEINTSSKFYDSSDQRGEIVYFREEEMLLTEAEAYARQGNLSQATILLNKLQSLRGAQETEGSVENILLERRKELYGEGLDWYDLKRNRKGLVRGSNHSIAGGDVQFPADSWRFVYQIPNTEIVNNPEMDSAFWPVGDQNPFEGVLVR